MTKEQMEALLLEAEKYKSLGEYRKAFPIFKKLAELGNPEAQNELSKMCFHGNGADQDLEAAVYWCKEAVKQNYAPSQYRLGWMYKTGTGVPQDDTEALQYLKLAADQGHLFAKYDVEHYPKK